MTKSRGYPGETEAHKRLRRLERRRWLAMLKRPQYSDVYINMPIMFIKMGEKEAKKEGMSLETLMFSLTMEWITDRCFKPVSKARAERIHKSHLA